MERLEKSSARVLIGAVLFSGALALMSFETFNSKVSWSCFNETRLVRGGGVPTPLPHSMESFLDLVRQVEGSHWAVDAADTAALLLRRCICECTHPSNFGMPPGREFSRVKQMA